MNRLGFTSAEETTTLRQPSYDPNMWVRPPKAIQLSWTFQTTRTTHRTLRNIIICMCCLKSLSLGVVCYATKTNSYTKNLSMLLGGKPPYQDSNSPFNDSNKNINRISFSETELILKFIWTYKYTKIAKIFIKKTSRD